MARRGFTAVMVVGLLTLAGSMATVAARKPKPKKGAEATRTAVTPTDPEKLSEFLIKPAEEAYKKNDFARAISLYRGILAIHGDGSDHAWKLAESWEAEGEFDSAIEELERYAAAVGEPAKRQKALDKIADLETREAGFGRRFQPAPAVKEATEAFKRGRAAYKAKRYADAILLFKAGSVMAPDLAGAYRELGFAYQELGRGDEANEFFMRYLRIRPFGKNADAVRQELARAKLVGKLDIESSFPCEQVWMNGQRMPANMKLPVKDLLLAPGRYKVLCYSEQYHFARYRTVEIATGQTATLKFQWAILENKLEPWGRIVIENPDRKGQMNDIGLFAEVGVPVPDDGRALDVILTAGDNSRRHRTTLRLEAGKRHVVKWP